MIEIIEQVAIDPGEFEETFVRASGPSGQNVNKVATAVQLRYDFLLEAGISAIYGPGTNIPQAAHEILGIVQERRAAAA